MTRVYDKIAAHPEFRFYGNVEMGRDITHADLSAYYHAIIYAVGARTDRRMGIPREHLPGSHSATEFVGWYNAHPDFRSLGFDLAAASAAVVGNGNVAMDLARILASPAEMLAQTDIAAHALRALSGNGIREIHVLGRRGPAQAAFTNKELKELGELPDVDVVVDPADLELDPLSAAAVAAHPEPHPRPQPGDPRRVRRTPARPARPSGSSCTSWSRRWRSSAPSGSRRSRSSTTSSTRARTDRSGRGRPSAPRPCRCAWSSGRSATRACRFRASPSTPCAG